MDTVTQLIRDRESREVMTQKRTEVVEPLLSWLMGLAIRMKNPGFKEEKEFRIITFITPDFFDPQESGLIPRTRIMFDPSCVKEVLIGPGQHMQTRESSVRYYLETKVEPSGRQRYPEVEVNASQTPFRGD
jgi:hypothetical protein